MYPFGVENPLCEYTGGRQPAEKADKYSSVVFDLP
jgi:hypothetical protein